MVWCAQLKQMNKNEESLNQNYLELTELRQVLEKSNVIFSMSDPASMLARVEDAAAAPDRERLLPSVGAASAFATREEDAEAGHPLAVGYGSPVVDVCLNVMGLLTCGAWATVQVPEWRDSARQVWHVRACAVARAAWQLVHASPRD
jgi:hypothetical protein